ncbi:MAG: hypothetical protein ACC662_00635 [Planctomycetota bacterium]
MWIGAAQRTLVGDRSRIEADVVFEDVDRPPVRVFFEADGVLAPVLEAHPEAFAMSALPAAVWQGERRLRIDGALDRTLAAGLEQAMTLFQSWFEHCRPLKLEPTQGLATRTPATEPYAVALCSGGVDALVMLQEDLATYPRTHPRAIRTIVLFFGASSFDFVDGKPSPAHERAHERTLRRLATLADRLGFSLAQVRTNAASLHTDALPYIDMGHSAVLLAPLVASGRRVTDAHLASSGAGARHPPHGSHPLLDELYSTSAVRVHLDQPLVSRHEKLGRLAGWAPAQDVVSPCHDPLDLPQGQVNCGVCEKCVRTMTGLLAWGALSRFSAFPADDVTPEMILSVEMKSRIDFLEATDLLEHLEAVGRRDLAEAVRENVRRQTESRWRKRRRKWRRSVRKRLGLA